MHAVPQDLLLPIPSPCLRLRVYLWAGRGQLANLLQSKALCVVN